MAIFCKTNAVIAFGRPKNFGLKVFVTNRASTSRETPHQNSRRTTIYRHAPPPKVKRLKTTSQQPHQLPHVAFNHLRTATCQQDTSPLACPVTDKSATTSVPHNQPVTQIFQKLHICPKTFPNYIFAPKFSKIIKLPLYFQKIQNYPCVF